MIQLAAGRPSLQSDTRQIEVDPAGLPKQNRAVTWPGINWSFCNEEGISKRNLKLSILAEMLE